MGIRSLLRKVFGRDRSEPNAPAAASVPPQSERTDGSKRPSPTVPSPADRAADLVSAAFDNPEPARSACPDPARRRSASTRRRPRPPVSNAAEPKAADAAEPEAASRGPLRRRRRPSEPPRPEPAGRCRDARGATSGRADGARSDDASAETGGRRARGCRAGTAEAPATATARRPGGGGRGRQPRPRPSPAEAGCTAADGTRAARGPTAADSRPPPRPRPPRRGPRAGRLPSRRPRARR